VLRRYPELFEAKFVDKALYLNLLAHIFSYCFDEDFLISQGLMPMGERCNHHAKKTASARLIDLKKHAAGPDDKEYFRRRNMANNYSAILASENAAWVNEEEAKHFEGQSSRESFEKYEAMLSCASVREQLLHDEKKQIWEVPARYDPCKEAAQDTAGPPEPGAKEQMITLNHRDLQELRRSGSPIRTTKRECIDWFVYKEKEGLRKRE
jgi:hypothetical protein